MKLWLILAISIFVLSQESYAECPAYDAIPIMYDDSNFMCFTDWQGNGDDLDILACNDCDGFDHPGYNHPDGVDELGDPCCMWPMGKM